MVERPGRGVRIGSSRWGLWCWSPIGWWLYLGRLTLGVRSHRKHRPLFSERYRTNSRRGFLHLGHLCLVSEWAPGNGRNSDAE